MAMPPHLVRSIGKIDATIFSGCVFLIDKGAREEMIEMVSRWDKKLKEIVESVEKIKVMNRAISGGGPVS